MISEQRDGFVGIVRLLALRANGRAITCLVERSIYQGKHIIDHCIGEEVGHGKL